MQKLIHSSPRWIVCLALLSVGMAFQPLRSVGQEDEAQTSTTSNVEVIDRAFLFSGEAPTSIDQLKFMESHFAELAEQVFPATVNIQIGASQGSGVVVSSDGIILTAAHVIGKPGQTAKITFLSDGTNTVYDAETLGTETGIDSGMLKMKEGQLPEYPYVEMGVSGDLNPGQWVMAVGHPGGIDLKRGLVVRIGRIISMTERVLKTDCVLVGGDSGGPLFDMDGNVIGIHSRIGLRLWDNSHVPVDTYSENWDLLFGQVIIDGTPDLGFGVKEDSNEVDDVKKEKSADEAGMKVGDIIIKLGGIEIEESKDISDAIKLLNLRPNKKTKIVVLRDGEEKTLNLKIGQKTR